MTSIVLLHSGHAVSWRAWDLHPTVVGAAIVIVGLYMFALGQEERVDPRRILCFLAGATVMFLSLVSPLDAAAHRLLSMHMLQHVVLSTIGPPLVLLGLPRDGLRQLLRRPALDRVFTVATLPIIAAPLFIVNMWLWHVPPVYEQALTTLPVHIAMHICFMATGFVFWWPVIQPLPERDRMGNGGRLAYLFVSGFPMGLLALLLVATPTVLYPYYSTGARLWGISPVEDQQVAGMIMGSLGEVASFVALSVVFLRFLGQEEAATVLKESIDAA